MDATEYGLKNGIIYGIFSAMNVTLFMDASGRLVLPKALRERLNLRGGASLKAEVVAGRIELTPVEDAGTGVLGKKGGITVLKRTGVAVDAAEAVAAERSGQEERGTRR